MGLSRDTIYITKAGDTVKSICEAGDAYMKAKVETYTNKTCKVDYTYQDTLTEVGYRKRGSLYLFNKEFPKIKWGEFDYYVKKSFANPNSIITYSSKVNIYKNERKYRRDNK